MSNLYFKGNEKATLMEALKWYTNVILKLPHKDFKDWFFNDWYNDEGGIIGQAQESLIDAKVEDNRKEQLTLIMKIVLSIKEEEDFIEDIKFDISQKEQSEKSIIQTVLIEYLNYLESNDSPDEKINEVDSLLEKYFPSDPDKIIDLFRPK